MARRGLLGSAVLLTFGALMTCATHAALADDLLFPNYLQPKSSPLSPQLDGGSRQAQSFQPVETTESASQKKSAAQRAPKAAANAREVERPEIFPSRLAYGPEEERVPLAPSKVRLYSRSKAMAQANEPTPSQQEEQNRKQAEKKNGGPQPVVPEVAPQEYDVFRDNAATLGSGKIEAAFTLGYTKNNGLIQYDRAVNASGSLRYGVMNGLELGLNVPYYVDWRTTQVNFGTLSTESIASFGDVTAQATYNVLKEGADYPAIHVSGGVTFPTGASPYYFPTGYQAGQNPINSLIGYQSRGQWGYFGNVLFVKTVDPLVLFGGFGFDQSIDTTVFSHKISWPTKFVYQAGVAFGVSERTSLGFTLLGSYQGNVKVDNITVAQTATEPILDRVSIVQRLFDPNTFAEPSLAWGLSKDAPNLVVNLTVRRRF
jgi:hypothetical protein